MERESIKSFFTSMSLANVAKLLAFLIIILVFFLKTVLVIPNLSFTTIYMCVYNSTLDCACARWCVYPHCTSHTLARALAHNRYTQRVLWCRVLRTKIVTTVVIRSTHQKSPKRTPNNIQIKLKIISKSDLKSFGLVVISCHLVKTCRSAQFVYVKTEEIVKLYYILR